MRPYFQVVNELGFTQQTRKNIWKHLEDNLDNFCRSTGETDVHGKYDWNWFLPNQYIPKDLAKEVTDRLCIPYSYEVLGQTPFTQGKIHKDRIDEPPCPPRISLLNFPIYPLEAENFGPTKYWKKLYGDEHKDYDGCVWEHVCEVDYTTGVECVIFNLQEYHCAWNDRHDHRFSIQFTTDLPFDEIVNLYDTGKLFK